MGAEELEGAGGVVVLPQPVGVAVVGEEEGRAGGVISPTHHHVWALGLHHLHRYKECIYTALPTTR